MKNRFRTVINSFRAICIIIMSLLIISGCSSGSHELNEPNESVTELDTPSSDESASDDIAEQITEEELVVDGYRQINRTKAQKMMEENEGYIILDVRTAEEYAEGHIPDAVNLPNESIGEQDDISLLSDKNQLIFVYCRSGRRSKEASKKLADLGYTNVYEFGGIIDWEGPTVKEDSEDLNEMKLKIGDKEIEVQWEENDSVNALMDMVEMEPLVIQLSMYGGNEQVGSIGSTLPNSDINITTEAGDIVLYDSSNIVIFYGSNTWDYTRLGKITDKSAEEMTELLSNGDVTVTIYMK